MYQIKLGMALGTVALTGLIEHGDYTETDRLIRDALRVYAFMKPNERIQLHKRELNRMKRELEREKKWAVF
jgi:uncharacterized small protein (DUF1192 family)